MLKEEFINEIAEIILVPPAELKEDKILAEFEAWDSIVIVSMIGMIDEYYNVSVKGCDLEKCNTLGEIKQLIQQRQTQ